MPSMLFAMPYTTEYKARRDILTFPNFELETEIQCFLKKILTKNSSKSSEAAPIK
jgi:hypothetical protein